MPPSQWGGLQPTVRMSVSTFVNSYPPTVAIDWLDSWNVFNHNLTSVLLWFIWFKRLIIQQPRISQHWQQERKTEKQGVKLFKMTSSFTTQKYSDTQTFCRCISVSYFISRPYKIMYLFLEWDTKKKKGGGKENTFYS